MSGNTLKEEKSGVSFKCVCTAKVMESLVIHYVFSLKIRGSLVIHYGFGNSGGICRIQYTSTGHNICKYKGRQIISPIDVIDSRRL